MRVMILLAGLESGAAAMTFLQPILTESQFSLISAALAIITPMVAMFMRQITTEAISEK